MSSRPSDQVLQHYLKRYNEALELKQLKSSTKHSKHLIQLEEWYQTQFKSRVSSSVNQIDNQHLKQDLIRLMQWKLARGKWRPRLEQLIASNSPDSVMQSFMKAKQALMMTTETNNDDDSFEQAMKALCELKGVGSATASAVLAAIKPNTCIFMSDEVFETLLPQDKVEYNLKTWFKLNQMALTIINTDQSVWSSVEQLEQACWSFQLFKRFDKLDDQPDMTTIRSSKVKRKFSRDDKTTNNDNEPVKRVRRSTAK
ncbi:hypothetical protein OIO90_003316 [Microbotryomycetes sp. JL221]|nr:hypothetical protein OIO90_003316 [Microbotryomycetes sp. JL221]